MIPSRFQIGDEVEAMGVEGTVVGVHFTESKVLYAVDLDIGGETLREVDSTFVEPKV